MNNPEMGGYQGEEVHDLGSELKVRSELLAEIEKLEAELANPGGMSLEETQEKTAKLRSMQEAYRESRPNE